jgi:hypothetical protein
MKVGTGVLYRIMAAKREFGENRYSDSRILLKGVLCKYCMKGFVL